MKKKQESRLRTGKFEFLNFIAEMKYKNWSMN